MRASQPPLLDPENFTILYTRTQIIVFRYIYAMLGGPIEDVEDLTCETYMRAWRRRDRFWGDDHDALHWLFTIARHLVIDTHRRKKGRSDQDFHSWDDDNIAETLASSSETPEEQAAKNEQFIYMWQVIQDLPAEKREMLLLRYMFGWKVKEIASFLHKQENTISVNIQRCLNQIRQKSVMD